jgi:hypothetical protein
MEAQMVAVTGTLRLTNGALAADCRVRFIWQGGIFSDGSEIITPLTVNSRTDEDGAIGITLEPGRWVMMIRSPIGEWLEAVELIVPDLDTVDISDLLLGVRGGTIPFSSRAEFERSYLPDAVEAWFVIHEGHVLRYIRDDSGTAIESGNGVKGTPGGTPSILHWGVRLDPAFAVQNVAAINAAEAWCSVLGMRLEYPTGVVHCTGRVNWHDQVEGVGLGGMPNWRVAPLTLTPENSTPAAMFDNVIGSELRFIGSGVRDLTIPNVTSSRQCGFGRVNPIRPWVNAFDGRFDLLDLSNQDANGATPATMRAFSTAVHLRTNTLSAPRRRNIRITLACDGVSDDGGHTLEGYKIDSSAPATADYDVGLYVQSPWQARVEDVQILGYWKLRGMLMTTMREGGDQFAGYAEGNIFRGMMVQGGTAVRSADSWPVIAKTVDSVTIPWTASHQFTGSGTLRIGPSFATFSTFTYSGLTYDAANGGTLTLAITSGDTASINVTTESGSPHHVVLSGGAGPALTTFENCQLYDLSHTSLVPEPGLGLPYRAGLEVSGPTTRAIRVTGASYLHTLGPLPVMIGHAADFQLSDAYVEPRRWRITFGGELQLRGGVIIAGPHPDQNALCGTTYNGPFFARGRWQHTSVNMAPLMPVSGGGYYSSEVNAGFFNPRTYEPPPEQNSLTSKDISRVGVRGRNNTIAARRADGTWLTGLQVRGSTGTVLIGRGTFSASGDDDETPEQQVQRSKMILPGPDSSDPVTLRAGLTLADATSPDIKPFRNDNEGLSAQNAPTGPGFRFVGTTGQMRIGSTSVAPLQLHRVGGAGITQDFRKDGISFGSIHQKTTGGERLEIMMNPDGMFISGGPFDPENLVPGAMGSIWLRPGGGPGERVYFKASGTGSTGWVAVI